MRPQCVSCGRNLVPSHPQVPDEPKLPLTILSHLLTKCGASGNDKAVALITRMSPAAWRHILLNGHYTFQSGGKMIDLDALLAGLDLE